MTCCCLPISSNPKRQHITFHWPNFTFARSQATLHSHPSQHYSHHHHLPFRRSRSAYTLHKQRALLPSKLKRKARLAPGAMSDAYRPPAGPPPGYGVSDLRPEAVSRETRVRFVTASESIFLLKVYDRRY